LRLHATLNRYYHRLPIALFVARTTYARLCVGNTLLLGGGDACDLLFDPIMAVHVQQEAEAEAEAGAQTEAEHVIVTPRLNRLISAEDENMVKVRLSL